MEKLLPGFVEISLSLSDQQIQEISEKLAKERQKYKEDYIDDKPSKIQARRIDNITGYVGRFFGSFNDQQQAMLVAWEENLVPYEAALLVQQKTLEENFLQSLRNGASKEDIELALRALMFYRSDDWEPELRKAIQANKYASYALMAKLFMSRTQKQKDKTNQKLDGYIEDLRALQNKD
jgi:hypothetical protein